MKVIDLLNKIANNEEVPREIKFNGELCSFDKEDKDYYCEEYGNIVWYLVDTRNNMNEVLDTELEIIEEKPKKIEEIYHCCMESENPEIQIIVDNINFMSDKINELQKAVNYLLEKESDK